MCVLEEKNRRSWFDAQEGGLEKGFFRGWSADLVSGNETPNGFDKADDVVKVGAAENEPNGDGREDDCTEGMETNGFGAALLLGEPGTVVNVCFANGLLAEVSTGCSC